MSLRTGVLAFAAIVAAALLLAMPASRSFASGVASRIVHLHAAGTQGPIPFILDLHKHKPRQTRPAPVRH